MLRLRQRQPGTHEARFLWQVPLIALPVVILSAVALFSLRLDRASIEQDARRNAGAVAAELTGRIGERLRVGLAEAIADEIAAPGSAAEPRPLCGLILDGRIRVPVDYPLLPEPPLWPGMLTGNEARLWALAASAAPQADLAAVRRAVAALAGAPLAVRANAEWCLLRAEANREGSAQLSKQLAELAARYPDVPAESGTPLADLALVLALQRAPAGSPSDPLVRAVRARVLAHPSFMTTALIEELARVAPGSADVIDLEERWRASERAHALLRQVPIDGVLPGEFPLELGAEAWVALVQDLSRVQSGPSPASGATCHVTFVPASLIERILRAAISAGAGRVPAYASVSLRFAGSTWPTTGAPGGGGPPVELASAAGRFELPLLVPSDTFSSFAPELQRIAPQTLPPATALPEGPLRLPVPSIGHAFTIGVNLSAPDALYASYRRRFWLAMGLVLAATLAALGGLAGAWRTFTRQQRLSEMKSSFVSSVSHELRAPIAAVRLMTESLERGRIEAADRRQEYIKAIGQECRRLSSLVENLLDYSRIDQGRDEYTFEPADIHALVAQTVELMGPFAAERQVRLVNAAASLQSERALERRVDCHALQQALVNLIDNAIKHSPAGAEVLVGVEQVPEAQPGGTSAAALRPGILRLFVEDHGPGVPVEEQDRIFEPFYRRGSELRRETRGIGIGLSIVKHVAEAHGGRVIVRSSPGAGSRFAIELPPAAETAPGVEAAS